MEAVRSSSVAALLFLTLLVLAAASGGGAARANDDGDERYVLVGLQTSGGEKIRSVVVADQRYMTIIGFAKGFSYSPMWFFREGQRRRLLPTSGNAGSHAEVVASTLLAGDVQ